MVNYTVLLKVLIPHSTDTVTVFKFVCIISLFFFTYLFWPFSHAFFHSILKAFRFVKFSFSKNTLATVCRNASATAGDHTDIGASATSAHARLVHSLSAPQSECVCERARTKCSVCALCMHIFYILYMACPFSLYIVQCLETSKYIHCMPSTVLFYIEYCTIIG